MENDSLMSVKTVEVASIVSMASASDDVPTVVVKIYVPMGAFVIVVKTVKELQFASTVV